MRRGDAARIVGLAQVARNDDELAVARAVLVGGEFHASVWSKIGARLSAAAACVRGPVPLRALAAGAVLGRGWRAAPGMLALPRAVACAGARAARGACQRAAGPATRCRERPLSTRRALAGVASWPAAAPASRSTPTQRRRGIRGAWRPSSGSRAAAHRAHATRPPPLAPAAVPQASAAPAAARRAASRRRVRSPTPRSGEHCRSIATRMPPAATLALRHCAAARSAGSGELRWPPDGDRYEPPPRRQRRRRSAAADSSTARAASTPHGLAPVRFTDRVAAAATQAANFQRAGRQDHLLRPDRRAAAARRARRTG